MSVLPTDERSAWRMTQRHSLFSPGALRLLSQHQSPMAAQEREDANHGT